MVNPQAVERCVIGHLVAHLQRRKPLLTAIRILGGSTRVPLYHKKKNQRHGKCRRTGIFSGRAEQGEPMAYFPAGEAGLLFQR